MQHDSGLFDGWDVNERRAGLALENRPLIPYSHDTGASRDVPCLWERRHNSTDAAHFVHFINMMGLKMWTWAIWRNISERSSVS